MLGAILERRRSTNRRALIAMAFCACASAAACTPAPAGRPTSAPVVAIAVPVAVAGDEPAGKEEPAEEPGARDDRVVRGMGEIRIGQTAAEVRRVLGKEDSIVTDQEERSAWANSDYEPEEGLVFMIGFDQILVYNDPRPNQTIPFWKIYLRGDRVVFMILTSYGFESMSLDEVGFGPSCYFLRDDAGVEATFGREHVLVKDAGHQHETYHYLDKGISVITSGGQIRVFDIYGDMRPEDRDRYRKVLLAAARKAAAAAPPP